MNFEDLTQNQQNIYFEKSSEMLSDLYYCTRVWEAWGYGTMTSNDFINASEDDDVVADHAKELYDFVQKQIQQTKV